MKLNLTGHEFKYAVEQIMLALFPDEKPEYSTEHTGTYSAESRLIYGSVYAQATTVIRRGDLCSRGFARIKKEKLTGKLISDRLLQRIIKQSFYRAALRFLDEPPVWGSLTGIRPAQIAAKLLVSGKSETAAERSLKQEYYVSPERAGLCVKAARSALALNKTLDTGDIALYIGIPFCPTRCAYCSFVSNSVERSFELIKPFMDVLLQEITETAKLIDKLGLRVVSVYIGGGTPAVLSEEALESIFSVLNASVNIKNVREFTVEAGRSDAVTRQKLDIISRSGAGRICINPQTMSTDVLKAIGRNHSPEDVTEAVKLVRETGAALNMDIIAGLPGDTPAGFKKTLGHILELKPENITIHTLSLKKGSRIMLEGTELPGASAVAEMLGHASEKLYKQGYEPYYLYRQKFTSGGFENTGWSLNGYECIYNICMMEELCTVISLGGGGVTKLVSGNGRIERIFNAKYPREYIMQKPPDERFSRHIDYKNSKIIEFYNTYQ